MEKIQIRKNMDTMGLKWTQSEPKMNPKLPQKWPKMNQE